MLDALDRGVAADAHVVDHPAYVSLSGRCDGEDAERVRQSFERVLRLPVTRNAD